MAGLDAGPCRLLDRTPSERSEDKLVFLNRYPTFDLFAESACSQECKLEATVGRSAAEWMGIDDESDQVP